MIEINADAKINLTLDIIKTRPDGYHEVEMIMQSVGLFDTIRIDSCDEGIFLETDSPVLPADESNLAWRAAELFLKTYNIGQGVRISIEKRIPIAAGLAGGSTDAAGVLIGMNKLFNMGKKTSELSSLGALVGSDVPFCIEGGTMLATGRGEKLARLPELPRCWIVVAKPPISVSTAWAYREYDSIPSPLHPDTRAAVEAVESGDIRALSRLCRNMLEQATARKYSEIEDYKKILSESGMLTSLMSGSGPSVFGIALSREDAERSANKLKSLRPEAEIFTVPTTGAKGY